MEKCTQSLRLFGLSFLINNVIGNEGMSQQAAAAALALGAARVVILLWKPWPDDLSISVEHEFGGWAGDIRRNKPGEMMDFVVNYVRVYQYKELL